MSFATYPNGCFAKGGVSTQGPVVTQTLNTSNIRNLPMFNPLSASASVPTNTVFPVAPFFNAEGYFTQPANVDKGLNVGQYGGAATGAPFSVTYHQRISYPY